MKCLAARHCECQIILNRHKTKKESTKESRNEISHFLNYFSQSIAKFISALIVRGESNSTFIVALFTYLQAANIHTIIVYLMFTYT